MSYLSSGLPPLSASERAELQAVLAMIERPPNADGLEAHLAMIAKMLLAFPSAPMTERQAEIRGEAYLEVLGDIPFAVLQTAIRQWLAAETRAPKSLDDTPLNFNFAPSPGVLRQVCLVLMEPMRAVESKIHNLLNAKPLDEVLASQDDSR